MSKSKYDHPIHRFIKVTGPSVRGYFWKCAIPGCRYSVHSKIEHLIIGNLSLCTNCGKTFTMDPAAMQMEFPSCYECRSGEDYTPIPPVQAINEVEEYEDPQKIRARIKMYQEDYADNPNVKQVIEELREKIKRMEARKS